MNTISIEYPQKWSDYELIDSGNGSKLERFNSYILSRPDPKIIWNQSDPVTWSRANAIFNDLTGSGNWQIKLTPPEPWIVTYLNLKFSLEPGEFKNIGVFPEQACNWDWLRQTISGKKLNILNLFAYTGGATMAAVASGASVTHVDSVKSIVSRAGGNIRLSKLPENKVRWIVDDAYKFILREARRGNRYDGIIMDPPKFGRGTKGEVWKFEKNFPKLLGQLPNILSPKPQLILINVYTMDISSRSLFNSLSDLMKNYSGQTSAGELALKESGSGRLLPSGIFARWQSS